MDNNNFIKTQKYIQLFNNVKKKIKYLPDDFNWFQYITLNYDIQHMNKEEAETHYVMFGKKEKRNYKFTKTQQFQIPNIYNIQKQQFNLTTRFKKNFIIKPTLDIFSRLVSIASAYSICKFNNYNLVINWIPDNYCECHIQELIVNIFSFAKIISNPIRNYLLDYKIYDSNDNIDINNNNIYIESNSELKHKDSLKYFYNFFSLIKWNDIINNVINEIPNINNYIGMDINIKNNKESINIDLFTNQINYILYNYPKEKLYISTDKKYNYEKLINFYGYNTIKILNNYDNSKNKIYYLICDIILLSKCKEIYCYSESPFNKLVSIFKSINKINNNIYFLNKIKIYNSNKLSVVIAHKNRINNLLKTIPSFINNDCVNDVVICDFNSNENIREVLRKNIKTNFWKINIIKITTKVQYIASHCNNIALYFAKNENILKLDADNIIIDSNSFFNNYLKYDLINTFIHFSWTNAKTENQKHVAGVFFVTKTDIRKVGYHNQKILFYGWEDTEYKKMLKEIKEKELILENNLLKHIDQEDKDRLVNQSSQDGFNYINFYGFDLKNLKNTQILNLYNKFFCEKFPNNTKEIDVINSISIEKLNHKYCECSLTLKCELFNNNLNYLNNYQTVCRYDIFEKIHIHNWIIRDKETKFYNRILLKYNIVYLKDKIRLFYLIHSNINKYKNNRNYNFLITLYNESNISRCIELLFSLKENLELNNISSYYILLENSNKELYLIKDILNYLSEDNKYIKIYNINFRPTFNYIFNFANNIIKGTLIFCNSDIVLDNSLNILNYLKDDQFISLTRNNVKNDASLEVVKFGNGNDSILSQDCWIFKSPMKYKLDNNFEIGTMFSDSYLNWLLYKSKYKCFNLYKTIIIKHIQFNPSCSKLLLEDLEKIWISKEKAKKKVKNYNEIGICLNTYDDFVNNINYNKFKENPWEPVTELESKMWEETCKRLEIKGYFDKF